MLLAWDPGESRVGFAMADYLPEWRQLDMKMCRIVPASEIYSMLELCEKLLKPDQKHVFIIENFRVDSRVRGAAFQWSEMQTVRMIGALEYAAYRMNNSPVFLQEPGIVLGQAKRWAPFKWPKGHLPDDKSAYCHLAYHAMKQNLIDTTDDITQNGQEKLW